MDYAAAVEIFYAPAPADVATPGVVASGTPARRLREGTEQALVGHRGSGKTSLHEALLFEAGAINRLGSVVDGTTVSDADPDEKSRQMSISASLASFEWQDRKVNLVDTPGDSSFIADALGALRVCESAVFVVNAVMGVEVHTTRLWQRADELDIAPGTVARAYAELEAAGLLTTSRASGTRVRDGQAVDLELRRAAERFVRLARQRSVPLADALGTVRAVWPGVDG